MQDRPSIKPLLAYEKKVNEELAEMVFVRCTDAPNCQEVIVNQRFERFFL